jgi:hypothetical protein
VSLQEAMESAAVPTDESTPGTPETPVAETPPAETPPEEGTEPTADFIGVTPEEPEAEEEGLNVAGEWELNVGIDEVIATVDGKPVTAGEVKSGFMRQADYTKKTTELAEYRKQAQDGYDFVEANRPVLERLATNDPAQVKEALLDVAKQYGVDLGSAPSGQQRGPNGQFISPQEEENNGLIDLSMYQEDSEAFRLGSALNASMEKNNSLETKLDNFLGQFQQEVASVQTSQTAQALASEWAGKGMADVNVDDAIRLVGQPMTVEQAMTMQNFEAIIRHTINVAKSKGNRPIPSEPGVVARKPGSFAGMSLSDALESTVHD